MLTDEEAYRWVLTGAATAPDTVEASALPNVSRDHPELDGEGQQFVAHMVARENAFRRIFGETTPPATVAKAGDDLLVSWPGGGFLRYAPAEGRPGWHWVTHGLSQPDAPVPLETIEDDDAWSGVGTELIISTPEQADWPVEVLSNVVRYQLGLGGVRPSLFTVSHVIPCTLSSLIRAPTAITHLLGLLASHHPSELRLPAGRATLVHLVGVTSAELEWVQRADDPARGAAALSIVLREAGIGTLTDASRACLTTTTSFDDAFHRALDGLHALPAAPKKSWWKLW